jgi:predicted SprT family Zn-dependent metalloprotease
MGDAMQPTQETYSALQAAYEYFNRELFDGALPECLITLQRRHKRTLGYFWWQRFEKLGGGEQKTDEIAMNPRHFKHSTVEEVLSTLVHEMAHQWQAHCGTRSRNAYHNREWGKKMESIGLMPSNTGQLGGKKTGQQMTHYIIPGGLFEQVCKALLSENFRLAWGEIVSYARGDVVYGGVNNRAKFTCPACDANAWGKPTLKLICGNCRMPMVAE